MRGVWEGYVAKGKTKYGYVAKCRVTDCAWTGELAKNEKDARKQFLAHASAEHVEIRPIPVKKKMVMEVIGE